MDDERLAVLLLQMGAPETIQDIRPFLKNLFSDPAIIPLKGPSWLKSVIAGLLSFIRAKKVSSRYGYIGGGSPLVRITAEQARALETWLKSKGVPALVRPVMRYSPPRAVDVISGLRSEGIGRFIAISLYPHYSSATTGSSIKDLRKALESKGKVQLKIIDRWGNNPGYIELLAEWINKEVSHLTEKTKREIRVIFSAHGLPQKLIMEGDPYLVEMKETVTAVGSKLGDIKWHLAFQSAVGPVKWLEPSTGSIIRLAAEEKVGGLLLVPISFVSDHIETLYDLDLVYRQQALERGISHYGRLAAFNDDQAFIGILGGMIIESLKQSGWDTSG